MPRGIGEPDHYGKKKATLPLASPLVIDGVIPTFLEARFSGFYPASDWP